MGGYNFIFDEKDGAPGGRKSPEEIILEDWVVTSQYLTRFKIEPDWTVLISGAWLGIDVVHFAKRCKVVYTLEPFLDTYKKLITNCELNNVTNVKAFPIGFSNANHIEIANITDASCASGVDINYEGNKVVGKTEITTTTWDDFTNTHSIKPDLCIFDMEGAENRTLEAMNDNLPKRLYISTYHPTNHVGNMLDNLSKKGYKRTLPDIHYINTPHSMVFEL